MKIAFFTVGCTGFMLFTMYQSYLSASLIVRTMGPLIRNIEEMKDFPHKLTMSDGGSVHKMFKNTNNDSLYSQLLRSGKIGLNKRDTVWIEEALTSKQVVNSNSLLLILHVPF